MKAQRVSSLEATKLGKFKEVGNRTVGRTAVGSERTGGRLIISSMLAMVFFA